MAGPLPHSKKITEMLLEYVGDAQTNISSSIKKKSPSSDFKACYRTALATNAILSHYSKFDFRPQLASHRHFVQLSPLHFLIGQPQTGILEIRRFIELTAWTVFFTHHPVEWNCFYKNPEKGYSPHSDTPISYYSHRELQFYIDYGKELFKNEPSGIALKALSQLTPLVYELNTYVHPGKFIFSRKIPCFEPISSKHLLAYCKIQRKAYSISCILISALNRKAFNSLPVMARAHFDWLIGTTNAKSIRMSAFGLEF